MFRQCTHACSYYLWTRSVHNKLICSCTCTCIWKGDTCTCNSKRSILFFFTLCSTWTLLEHLNIKSLHMHVQYLQEVNWLPSQSGFSIIPASWYIKALPDKLPNISPQCSRMSLNTMRGKTGQQFSIYCTFPDHIQPTLTGHFQFKIQNHGIVVNQQILETAHQSIGLNAN